MPNMTEKLAQDLPLAAIPVATEVANFSLGKVIPQGAESITNRYADRSAYANRPRDPNTAVNEDQHELLADVAEVWNQIEVQGGVVAASMLNMHPWAVHATGPHNEGIQVPACPIQEDFVQFVQRSPRFDFGDRWGKFKVRPIWPIEIMHDFQRQHFSWGGGEKPWGGLVVYMGDHAPGNMTDKPVAIFDRISSLIKRVSDSDARKALEIAIEEERKLLIHPTVERATLKEIKELMHKARAQQVSAYEDSYDKGEQSMASFLANQKGAGYPITRYQRLIAQWLFHRGLIKKLPSWVTERRPRGWEMHQCKKCGAELSETGYSCSKCGRVDKPFPAFQDGEITATSACTMLMNRGQLETLTSEERKILETAMDRENGAKKDVEEPKKAKKPE